MNYTNNIQKKFLAEDSQSLANEEYEEEEESPSSSELDREEQEHYEFWLWQMFHQRK